MQHHLCAIMRETEVFNIVARCRENRGNLCYPVSPIVTLNMIGKLQDIQEHYLPFPTQMFRSVTILEGLKIQTQHNSIPLILITL